MKTNIIRFGDIILLAILLTLGSLSITSCALFSGSAAAGQKLADVRNLSFAAASIGTQEALLEKPLWRAQFENAALDLDMVIESKTVTGAVLRNILAGLPVKELESPQARIAIEAATVLYDSTVGDRINIEAAPYVMAAATGIRDGIKAGLR